MAGISKFKTPVNDNDFDTIFPERIRKLSARHFTSIEVSRMAVEWLNGYNNLKLLDIGCGVGKFCLMAALGTKHGITGADFRNEFIKIAIGLKNKYELKNLDFVNQNIMDVDFKKFNAFYLFNPFLEQVDETARMDEVYETSPLLYSVYENHVKQQLQEMPKGTIIITYYVTPQQIPFNYVRQKTGFNGFLRLWEKN